MGGIFYCISYMQQAELDVLPNSLENDQILKQKKNVYFYIYYI